MSIAHTASTTSTTSTTYRTAVLVPTAEPRSGQPTLAVALIALLALGLGSEEWLWPASVIAALLAAVVIPLRLPDFRAVGWVLRAIAFAVLIATESEMRRGTPVNNFVPFFKLVGRCCAAEMIIRTWQPSGLGVAVLPLSAMVMLPVVFGPARPVLMWGLVPAYLLAMVAVTRSHRPGVAHRAAARVLAPNAAATAAFVAAPVTTPIAVAVGWRRWLTPAVWGTLICLPAAIALGLAWADTIDDNSLRIRTWLTGVDLDRAGSGSGVGFSPAPRIGPAPGPRPSLTRVLRLEGATQALHLRAASFDVFDGSSWGPPISQHQPLREVGPLGVGSAGSRVGVARLHNDLGNAVFVPLHAAGLELPDGVAARADPRDAAALRAGNRAPFRYTVTLPEPGFPEHQGPLCVAPTPAERQRLLKMTELSVEMRMLIATVAHGRDTPRAKIDAVVGHLTSQHKYSLQSELDSAKPVEDFVLNGKPGHCELFATSAVLMLREMGVPSRYVVGFYAHEAAPGGLVVRQRDAHAWAEAWVDGTGWVTVEATAADGLPDSRFEDEPAPLGLRLSERLADAFGAVQTALDGFDWQWWGLFVGIPVLAAAAAWGWWRTRQTSAEPTNADYWSPGPEWAQLAERVERLLTEHVGRPCPPNRTWEEHFSDWRVEPSLATLLSDYRSVRFGRPDDATARRKLLEQLNAWEARAPRPTAAKTDSAPQ